MKLKEIFEYFDKQEITTSAYLKEQFNRLPLTAMTDDEAKGIYFIIENRLGKLYNCETIYDDEETGLDAVKVILKQNIVNLTVEIRNILKAVDNDVATSHQQTKFNPIDNDDIKNAPINMDNISFNYLNNMVSQCDYLAENSKYLGYLYTEFANMCYITGTGNKASSGSYSSQYATKTQLAAEATTRAEADTELAGLIEAEATTRAEADTELAGLIEAEQERATTAENDLSSYCDALDGTKAGTDYVLEQDASTLQSAKDYTDSEISKTGSVKKEYVDTQDQAVKSYADATFVNLTSQQDVSGIKNFTSGRVCLGDGDKALVYDSNDDTMFLKNGAENYVVIPQATGTVALTSDIPEEKHLYRHHIYATVKDSSRTNTFIVRGNLYNTQSSAVFPSLELIGDELSITTCYVTRINGNYNPVLWAAWSSDSGHIAVGALNNSFAVDALYFTDITIARDTITQIF